MSTILSLKKLNSFQRIILGFLSVILIGSFLLMLPFSSKGSNWTSFGNALFTSTSAVCVTGLVVRDTATYWSQFGQAVILLLIQIGGLGIISVAAVIASLSGRKISLLQRSALQDCISAHEIGDVVMMTTFIFKVAFVIEFLGMIAMLPVFCSDYGARGIWMAFFHSISAFCNAGFDIMGHGTNTFVSLTRYSSNVIISLTISLLIITGGIGFLVWSDIIRHKYHLKRYKMQSKVIIVTTAFLIVVPTIIFAFSDFSSYPLKKRLCLSFFQAVTPRTAGFNTANLTAMSSIGRSLIIILMLIGGSPGSTAGGMKTTTIAVLFSNAISVFRRKKSAKFFGRRIDDSTIKDASTIMIMYICIPLTGAFIISGIEGLPIGDCLYETASALGTVGLSLGLTPSLGHISHLILIMMMFWGRVGGLTLMFAALSKKTSEVSQYPVEKINVG